MNSTEIRFYVCASNCRTLEMIWDVVLVFVVRSDICTRSSEMSHNFRVN